MTADGRDAGFDAQLQQAFAIRRSVPGSGHPSADDWARFASHEMSSDERTEVADHVVSCTECAAIFRVVSRIGADGKGIGTVDRRGFDDWRRLAAAAAVVFTIGLGAWWAVRTRGDQAIQQAAGDAPPRITTPEVDRPAAQPPSWASLSSAPDVRLPPDLVLTMRGTGGDRDGFLKVFGEAIAPYRAGRFAEAAAALAPVAARHADVVEVWFYLGAARLYGEAPAEAVEPLRRARSSSVVGDDARWLEAVALQRARRHGEAQAALQALCSAPGLYHERACAAVNSRSLP